MGWRPGGADDGVAQRIENIDAVLAGGGDVAADAEPGAGAGVAAVAA